jgi:phage gp45-like
MAIVHEINRALEPVYKTMQMLVSRVVISGIRWAPKLATAQLRGLFGETLEGVESFSHYGFASYPREGAEGVVLAVGAIRDHAVLIATADRRVKITLDEGEVALHDDLGQKVHLKRSGIEIDTPGDVDITAGGNVVVHADGSAQVDAGTDASVEAVGDVDVTAGAAATVEATDDVTVNAGGDVTVNAGGVVNLGGAGGAAVARVGDDVDDLTDKILSGSAKVFAVD